MQDRPTAPELIDAIVAFLEEDLLPDLSGRKGFHTRVSINLLRILRREWEGEAAHRAADGAALEKLLDHEGGAAELAAELAQRIRTGEFDDREGEVLTTLREMATRKLEVANPRYVLD